MPGVVIGPAGEDDVDACAELETTQYGGDPAESAPWFRMELTAPNRRLLVARVAGEVVGYARVTSYDPVDGYTAPAGHYLGGVVVRPGWRRRGVGLALTTARMDHAFAVADRVWYFANEHNAPSIAMHARLGFLEVTRDFTFPGVAFEGGDGVLFCALRPPMAHR